MNNDGVDIQLLVVFSLFELAVDIIIILDGFFLLVDQVFLPTRSTHIPALRYHPSFQFLSSRNSPMRLYSQ